MRYVWWFNDCLVGDVYEKLDTLLMYNSCAKISPCGDLVASSGKRICHLRNTLYNLFVFCLRLRDIVYKPCLWHRILFQNCRYDQVEHCLENCFDLSITHRRIFYPRCTTYLFLPQIFVGSYFFRPPSPYLLLWFKICLYVRMPCNDPRNNSLMKLEEVVSFNSNIY